MGRSFSPTLLRELENIDKDPDSYKSVMRSLKSYVKDLDFEAIPIFVAQVSETAKIGSLSKELTVSLYEVLAQVHSVKIVPMIGSIMQSIVQTLASSAGSLQIQEACSKVVLAIARYGIDPTTAEDKKRNIICSLCKPLCDGLSSTQECLTSGAALCLKALVDSDNWRFASDEMVNKVCLNVAAALEGKSQANSHMDLVMSLAKSNPLIVEAYARLLIQAGLRILNAGAEILEANFQKRLAAIQMVNFLMKCIDPRSIFSELEQIIEKMEICQFDNMACVKDAAYEALQTARRITASKKSGVKSPASVTGSNFRSDCMEADRFYGDEDHSPTASISPEPRTLDFFPGYEYAVKSPILASQPSQHSKYSRRGVNRKLWSQGNGRIDVSLRDGLFSAVAQENAWSGHTENPFCNQARNLSDEFAGFVNMNSCHRVSRSTTTSPRRSQIGVNSDTMNIFMTPRKLIHSLEDPDAETSCCSNRQSRRYRSLSTGNVHRSRRSNFEQDENCFTDYVNCDCNPNGSLFDYDEFQDGKEPVSPTDDIPVGSALQVLPENSDNIETVRIRKPFQKTKYKVVCGLSFALLAMATPLLWITNQEDGHYLVPT
ncbi:protein SINE1-like [Arachis stenosperma]|uniref:protein SINE1-like n=1 Tax=Arachis stenosperma TaxID=217475 RepID=UPI0025AD8702|nr:protein SINE1-like [Arachis stenosperma]